MTFRRVDLGMIPAHLARINYAGDLGYELWVAPEYQRALFDRIVAAGEPHGLRLFGMRALMSLRLEKSYGTWFREYRPIYTPLEGGHHALPPLDHEFIGRAAHEAELAARRPEATAVRLRRRARPRRPGRRHRRRADLARRRGRGLGHLGRLRAPRPAVDRPGLRADRAGHARRPGRPRLRDRDHRSTTTGAAPARAALRPAGPADAPVTDRPRQARARRRPSAMVGGRLVVDGRPIPFEAGDSVAIAILRAGEVPGRGGTLCLAGDCGNCLATVDGVAYVRTCQAPARPGWPSCATRSDEHAVAPRGGRRRRDAAAACARGRRRRAGRRRSWSSVAARPASGLPQKRRRQAATSCSSMPRRAARSWPSTRARRSWCGRRTGCSTSTRPRSSSRPARPRSSRSARATIWPASLTARAAERLHAAGVDLAPAVAVGTATGRRALPARWRARSSASRATTQGGSRRS